MTYVETIQKLTHVCGECWIWSGADNGNGMPKYKRKLVRRELFSEVHGAIPAKRYISTSCKTPYCVNPEHLIARTKHQISKEANNRPATRAKKAAASAKTNQAKMGKITMQIAEEIRARPETGRELAEIYGISTSLVSKVRQYRGWKPLSNPFAGLL